MNRVTPWEWNGVLGNVKPGQPAYDNPPPEIVTEEPRTPDQRSQRNENNHNQSQKKQDKPGQKTHEYEDEQKDPTLKRAASRRRAKIPWAWICLIGVAIFTFLGVLAAILLTLYFNGVFNPSPTGSVNGTSTTTTPLIGTKTTTTASSALLLPVQYANKKLPNGVSAAAHTTLEACQFFCKNDPDCLAADFNNNVFQCFLHTVSSGTFTDFCFDLQGDFGLTHGRKTDCSSVGNPTTISPSPTTTTPTATTTTPPAGPLIRYPDTSLPGGLSAFMYTSLLACEFYCDSDPDCWAIDFNLIFLQCFVHKISSGSYTNDCSNLQSYAGNMHSRKIACGATAGPPIPATTANSGTMLPVRYNDMSLSGGILDSAFLTSVACETNCYNNADCLAVDYNTYYNECYVHNSTSASYTTSCADLLSFASNNHARKASCGAMLPVRYIDMSLSGGILDTAFVTSTDCETNCYNSPDCLAVDYNTYYDECYVHNSTSASYTSNCGDLQSFGFNNHARKSDCVSISTTTASAVTTEASTVSVSTTLASAVTTQASAGTLLPIQYVDMSLAGGILEPAFVTSVACETNCNNNADCLAVDYNTYYNECYVHNSTSASYTTSCADLQSFAYNNHARKSDCV